MYPLFETIAIENGKIQNIALHQQRYERSLQQFYGKNKVVYHSLVDLISIPTTLNSAQFLIRCRISYNDEGCDVQYFPYQCKTYRTFQPVICNDIDYSLKFNDRSKLTELLRLKGNCDEIMIIKQGYITDCSIGNLIFRKGVDWFTPNTPLLKGTMREKLLNRGAINEIPIKFHQLNEFEEVRLINALNGLVF